MAFLKVCLAIIIKVKQLYIIVFFFILYALVYLVAYTNTDGGKCSAPITWTNHELNLLRHIF